MVAPKDPVRPTTKSGRGGQMRRGARHLPPRRGGGHNFPATCRAGAWGLPTPATPTTALRDGRTPGESEWLRAIVGGTGARRYWRWRRRRPHRRLPREPIHAGYVLIKRDHLVNVSGLEHERW